jgi:hypothetical protein
MVHLSSLTLAGPAGPVQEPEQGGLQAEELEAVNRRVAVPLQPGGDIERRANVNLPSSGSAGTAATSL